MFLILVTIFIIAFYIYSTRNHDYWTKKKVAHDTPIPLFGNSYRNLRGLKNMTQISEELYMKYPNEKVIGYYRGATPVLIIRDLDIVRRILNVDFAYLYQRGIGRDPKKELLLGNLFHSDDDTWKLLRQRLTPIFTTAKLKKMFPLIIKCAEKLQIFGKDVIVNGGECDVKELMARFGMDFIGACGFGIEMDAINNEQSLFREFGKMVLKRGPRDRLFLAIYELFPFIRKYIRVYDPKFDDIIMEIVEVIRKQRNYKPIGRNDFIDQLLELQLKGSIVGDSMEKKKADGSPALIQMEMDLKCFAAQVFIFFVAGFETSSSATSFTLHQLAFNPEIQIKVQNQIDEVLLKYKNKLCYDAVSEMTLLDIAFKESLRLFPSLGILNRACAKRYTITELNLTIEPGVRIIIPVKAIHHDKEYYDNPSEYRPERFNPDSPDVRHRYAYLPFGEGPRACIGARLGQMQSIAGLAAVLQKFSVEPLPTTPRELEVSPTQNTVQSVEKGIPLKLKLRKHKDC